MSKTEILKQNYFLDINKNLSETSNISETDSDKLSSKSSNSSIDDLNYSLEKEFNFGDFIKIIKEKNSLNTKRDKINKLIFKDD